MIEAVKSKKVTIADKIAKLIRVISVPPVMLTSLLLLLQFASIKPILSQASFWVLFLCLGVLPLLAYPAQMLLPSWREKGRALQRKMAFGFSIVGYLSAGIASFWLKGDANGVMLCHGYCFALLMLVLLQKIGKLHASGHACSVTGPLFYIGYFFGMKYLLIGIAVWSVIFWSSLRLGRHSKTEFFLGSLCAILGALLSIVW